jgi:hypothetical protein
MSSKKQFMKNFLKQYRLILIAFVIFIAMLLVFWFAVRPMYFKILSLRDAIEQENARQENQQKQIKRLPELKNQYERVVSEERYFDILLTEDKVVGFIRILEGLAGETGVVVKIQSNETKLEEVKKKSSKDKDAEEEGEGTEKKEKLLSDYLPYPEYLRLTLTVEGDYSALVAFLSRLETLPVALDVMGIEVKQPLRDDNSRDGDVRAVNPFATESTKTPSETTPDNGDGTTDEVPSELTKPLSPRLEAVIDLIVYVDKK